jgi:uncharacterized protein YkwD
MALEPPPAALPAAAAAAAAADQPPWFNTSALLAQPLAHTSKPGMLPTSGTTAPDVLASIPPLLAPERCKIRPDDQQQQQQLDPGPGVLHMAGVPVAVTASKAVRMEARHRAVGGFRLAADPPAQYSSILAQHNSYRSQHQVPGLQWDALLASSAADYAASCVFEHDAASNAGENLYASSATAADTGAALMNAVRLW